MSISGKESGFAWREILHFTCSGVLAGFPSALVSRPLLVVTTPMHAEMKKGTINVMRSIYQAYGWKGFVNGLTPSLVASVPGTPLMYVGTQYTSHLLGDSALAKLLSGYVGMASGCLAYVPPTIINQSKQTVGVNAEIQNSSHIKVAKILYQRKGIAGFYTGYWLQVGSFGTCNALGLFLTSKILKKLDPQQQSDKLLTFASYILGYTAAGFLTNPLELIKRQRQIAWANPSMFPDKSARGVVKRIVKIHGISGLYRGALVHGLWAAARFGTAYATGDAVKEFMDKEKLRGLQK